MKIFTIYIASSWKNQHAVEMLTKHLEEMGHRVVSFVREAFRDRDRRQVLTSEENLDEWVASQAGARKFKFDTDGALKSDLVIYVGPSGMDAWAEIGAAWAAGKTILGLWAKGEQVGLNRRMVHGWYYDFHMMLCAIQRMAYQ